MAVDLQQKAMSGSQGLIVVGAHTRLGYVHYLRGHYDEAIHEYRRELTFLTHSDHALRDRSIIEVNQKLAAAYARQGAAFEAREFADHGHRGVQPPPGDRRRRPAHPLLPRRPLCPARRRRARVASPRLRPLAELGPFTRWRLPRDPDFAGVLAHPVVAARLRQADA